MAGSGRKVWTRETLSSAEVQSYLQDQVVMQFPSVAARDTEVPAPTKGMRTTQLDSLTETIHDGAAWRRAGGRRAIGSVIGGVPDANGVLIVPHPLGVAPSNIQLTARSQISDLLDRIALPKARNADANGFVVFIVRTDTSAYLGGSPISFDWSAEL